MDHENKIGFDRRVIHHANCSLRTVRRSGGQDGIRGSDWHSGRMDKNVHGHRVKYTHTD